MNCSYIRQLVQELLLLLLLLLLNPVSTVTGKKVSGKNKGTTVVEGVSKTVSQSVGPSVERLTD